MFYFDCMAPLCKYLALCLLVVFTVIKGSEMLWPPSPQVSQLMLSSASPLDCRRSAP